VWREGYGAFGERLKKPAAADNVGYTGKQHDNASGLSYFGARWYDPAIGRFMGYDPAGFDEGNPGSFNRYGYGNNNPYKYVDPDGRLPVIAYAAIVYAPEIAAAAGAAFAAMRAAPALARFTASGLNTLTQIANSPTTHAVVEAAAGLATNTPGGTSVVSSAGTLTKGAITNFTNNVQNLSRTDLIKGLESVGLRITGSGQGGKFMEFSDKAGRVRAKIHPPDKKTPTDHLHLYDSNGNSLNRNLEVVPRNDPAAHIPIN
jgi:RHS repeat-associated protein